MLKIGSSISINATQAKDILTRHTEELGLFIDLDRACWYQSYFQHKIRPIVKEMVDMAGHVDIVLTKREEIRSILLSRFKVPIEKFIIDPKKDKPKLDAKVIAALSDDDSISDDARRFVKLFSEGAEYQQRISGLKQYVELPLCKRESYDGHRMVLAKPTWAVLSTGRISARDPSIQNIARELGDLITYPKGYILVRSDSGQIEPRIIYSAYIKDPRIKDLITLYDDAYFGLVHFAMYPDLQEKMEITDELKGYRSQLKTMANATNYGGNLEGRGFNPELSRGFMSRIQKHPERDRWLEEVKASVARGSTTFYTFFGTAIKPESTTNYTEGGGGWQGHLERCGINNPVQGTAGDLMCESVYHSDILLTRVAKGWSRIAYYKHDEGAWYLDECDENLANTLAGYMAYQVQDWIPINSDMLIGQKEGLVTEFVY